jgi:hypothetical protein
MSVHRIIDGSPVQHPNKGKKFCRENLLRFVETDELTPAMKAAKTRSERGDCGFYGYLRVAFPLHYRAFRNMHDAEIGRFGAEVAEAWDMTSNGFITFILDVGPIPPGLKHPILVRINPDLGFIPGNVEWRNETKFRPASARRAGAMSVQARYTYSI